MIFRLNSVAKSTRASLISQCFIKRSLTTGNVKKVTYPEYQVLENQIKINWSPYSSSKFHHVWLRDTCRCPECFHPSSKQKLISSADIPLNIKPASVNMTSDLSGIEVTWSHSLSTDTQITQHKSKYDFEFLRKCDYSDHSLRKNIKNDHPLQLWDASLLRDVNLWKDYSDFMSPEKNDEHLYHFVDLLQRYGIGFIKNVPINDINMVETVAQRFGPIRETFYGRSWNVVSVPEAKNIAYTSLFLDLHMDLMYFESPPGLQLLHCLENSATGGESIFLDMHKIVSLMERDHPEEFRILTQVPVTFEYANNNHHLKFSRPTITVDDLNHLVEVYYAPPFQGPLSAPADKVEKFYRAFKVLGEYMRDKSFVYEIRLNPGDCVVFANRRVLHGRQAFDGKSGRRHLKGTYVDWDVLMDRYRVLRALHRVQNK